jgi:alpha-1,2-mannosyltransferase
MRMTPLPPGPKLLLASLAALLLAAAFLSQTAESLFVWDTDSPSYYAAAHGLRRGVNIYDDTAFQAVAEDVFGQSLVVFPYIYPPLLAQVLVPLAALTPSGYFLALQILNWGLAFLTLFLIARLLDFSPRTSLLPILFLFALLPWNRALFTTINHGQINLLVLDAILAFLLFRRSGRPWLAGFFLSLAILVKIYPAVFVLPLLLGRKWKQLAALAGTGTALLLASILHSGARPWREFLEFTGSTVVHPRGSAFLFGFESAVGNVSLNGFFHHLFEAFGFPRSAAVPAWGLSLAVLIAAVILLVRRKRWESDLGFQASVLLLLTLLFAPISWSHHYVVVLVPAAYLFGRILGERRYPALGFLGAFAGLAMYHPSWCGFPFNQARTWGALLLLLFLLIYDRTRAAAAGVAKP